MRSTLHVVRLSGADIMRQLRLEEALLRTDTRNVLLLSRNLPARSVVVGIGGRVSQVAHSHHCKADSVPLIRRFTGGGTVLLDSRSWLVSLIANRADTPSVLPDPAAIMRFTANQIYAPVFNPLLKHDRPTLPDSPDEKVGFGLQQHDYCIGLHKIGGNAQYLTHKRWLHHTSFLWDYDADLMNRYLKMPPLDKRPAYRRDRPHQEFLVRMKDYFSTDLDGLTNALLAHLQTNFFDLEFIDEEDLYPVLNRPHHTSTRYIEDSEIDPET
eukprot:TRINITY_DN10409_c0_g1_i1.p1 TRINITY_DN10409_c0_g1~~TRINITY_DN10409_c0_g1_i1.p1  ORF type:complete len:269 (-),score=39.92 TRINITY_DN10409_c0_g1_i1:88-894(-)